MLPRLQLAALLEQKGSARRLADALAQYLEIATEWPSLVEARYRASVVAATLASMTGELTPTSRDSLAKSLGVDGGSKPLNEALSKRAKTESRSVLKLLQPYYTLLREGRLRSRYEPQGADRRELKRAVAISRHCLGLRSIGVKTGFTVTLEIWGRRALVRWWHMALGRPSVGWQAHYNAACFYALLQERQEQLPVGGANG
jgi:hypothetical protein